MAILETYSDIYSTTAIAKIEFPSVAEAREAMLELDDYVPARVYKNGAVVIRNHPNPWLSSEREAVALYVAKDPSWFNMWMK